ncbi:Dynein light chain LC6 flagellar outer arm [Taenia crassiceps]|uniref:Dynein light chain n=1 Tax=Taenia crassiceps TaxID=6207 RepID=A0ABR4QK86_9CEST
MPPVVVPPERQVQVTVKCFCMPEDMLNYAAILAEEALKQCTTRKDVAAYVKKRFDEKYGPLWHCVVGRDFGSYVTHQEQGFVVFRVDEWAFLLFSTRH